MAEVILMPRLSDTMTEGVIAAWHKNVGDAVIGTTKGGKLQVNDLLAIIGKAGEDVASLIASVGAGSPAAAPATEPAPATATAAPIAASASPALDVAAMDEVVLMPRLSDTMTEGVIAGWQKNVGDTVKKGEVLADIETDKATMELESYKDGILLYQGAKAGEKILVNDLLCVIGAAGTNVDAIVAAVKNGATAAAPAATAPEASPAVAPTTPTQATAAAPAPQVVVNEGRIFASPLARKMAEERGIDLKYVKGTGDNGRITKFDIDGYVSVAASANQAASAAAPAFVQSAQQGVVSFEDQPVSQMRKTIARRLSESLFTAPHFYITMTIDMDAAVAARAKINEVAPVKISFNDMVVKATALSLKQHPKINSSWLGDTIRTNHHVNIGIAVAVDEGLLVPVVRFADTKSLSEIGVTVKGFAQKAKDKKLQPADWEGSTFTISNLGMFGVDEFTAIINPPDACILAVGGIAQVPVVKNGQVVPGNVMKVTLSCDHRVVDGAAGAAFLQTLKSLLEEPLRMLV